MARGAVLYGALFGFCVYAAYDLTQPGHAARLAR